MGVSNTTFADRLQKLRAELARLKLDGFIVPHADEYQGEFIPPSSQRLLWLTGFSGSAGAAVILQDRAVVLTDGRYTLQLAAQVDRSLYEYGDSTKLTIAGFLAEKAGQGDVIGYDPRLHTPRQLQELGQALSPAGIVLQALEHNPLDAVWVDRPPPPCAPAQMFPEAVAGRSGAEKRGEIAQKLRKEGLYACILTATDSLAWLLNVRGADVEYTPVVLSYGVLYADGRLRWIVAPQKLTQDIRAHTGPDVEITEPEKIRDLMADLTREAGKMPVGLDYASAPVWFKTILETSGASVRDFKDPCILPRAIKTAAEQASIREVHIADGAALVSFLAWLDAETPKVALTELDIVARLESCRRLHPDYRGPSFATIAGFGPNGAIVHYRPTADNHRPLADSGILLLDSGGQYAGGTTDITRTVAFGDPGAEFKKHFTLVLKAHIAVATARFPEGTLGSQIDALARQPLWVHGLDYAHGTGHGVGCYLSVHEASANLSPRGSSSLHPGMLLSNEPGYYKTDAYGIRIENLVFVQHSGEDESGRRMLGFETVSLAPVQRDLILKSLLTDHEILWLDDYHRGVQAALSPHLKEERCRSWLAAQTAPL